MRTASARALTALALLTAASLAGCAASGPTGSARTAAPSTVSVTHAQGTTEVPVKPAKVVTFDMASLDTLDELDVKVTGLPKSSVPDYLDEYSSAKYTDVGTLFEPDYEAVNELAPDLIIVANRSAKALPELQKIAPTIDLTLDWADYLGSFTKNVTTLGTIFQKQAQAKAELADLQKEIAETKKLAAKDGGNALVVLTSGGEITAFGPGSRFGWIHDELGVTPAVADVEAATHGDPVSNEFILQTNPDRLFVIDRDAATGEGGTTAKQILDNEVIHGTNAWKNKKIVYLDPVPFYVVMSGLTAVDEMVDQIKDGLS
jgi:iron complex transport system substrate-binding protein